MTKTTGRDVQGAATSCTRVLSKNLTTHRLIMLPRQRAVLVAACSAFLSGTAVSQARPSSMPTDLVSALMASGVSAGEKAEYFVDTLPAGWPSFLSLSSARILGGMKAGGRLVAVFADTSRSALPNYRRVLMTNGFTKPIGSGGHGFLAEAIPANLFCRGSARVAPRVPEGIDYRAFLVVTYDVGDPATCSDAVSGTLILPPLVAPPSTDSRETVQSANSEEVTSRTRLYTMLPPSVILPHYAKQLAAAGWTVGTQAFSPTVGALALETRDKIGRYWSGSLVISATGDARDVQITMRNDRY